MTNSASKRKPDKSPNDFVQRENLKATDISLACLESDLACDSRTICDQNGICCFKYVVRSGCAYLTSQCEQFKHGEKFKFSSYLELESFLLDFAATLAAADPKPVAVEPEPVATIEPESVAKFSIFDIPVHCVVIGSGIKPATVAADEPIATDELIAAVEPVAAPKPVAIQRDLFGQITSVRSLTPKPQVQQLSLI